MDHREESRTLFDTFDRWMIAAFDRICGWLQIRLGIHYIHLMVGGGLVLFSMTWALLYLTSMPFVPKVGLMIVMAGLIAYAVVTVWTSILARLTKWDAEAFARTAISALIHRDGMRSIRLGLTLVIVGEMAVSLLLVIATVSAGFDITHALLNGVCMVSSSLCCLAYNYLVTALPR